jgi:hypothetical protein
MLVLISIVLAVPATLGLMHMLRERHVAAGHVGGGLALVGLLAFTGVTAVQLVVWQMAQPQLERGQMVSLLQASTTRPGSSSRSTCARPPSRWDMSCWPGASPPRARSAP